MVGATFIPLFFYYAIAEITEMPTNRWAVYTNLFFCVLLLPFLFFSDFVIAELRPLEGFSYWPIGGVLFLPFLFYFFLNVVLAHVFLLKKYLNTKNSKFLYMFLATFIAFASGSTNYFLWLEIPIKPYGNIFVSLYVMMIAYAITKHRLLDISIVITRTLSWLLSGIALFLVVGGGFWLAFYLGWVVSGVGFWIGCGVIAAGLLWMWPRVAIWVQTPLEKTFLRAKVDPLGAMYDFTSSLSATATLSGITTLTAKTILNHFELKYVATIQPRGQAIDIQVWGFRDNEIALLKETVFEYALCQETLPVQITENPPLNVEAAVLLPSEIFISDTLRDMLGVGPERVLHLPLNDAASLYICLGPKLAERKLNATELKLLAALSVQAMTALQRSLPYEEAVRNYENQIKLIGAAQTIVTINHQLNSPLTAIKMAFDMLSKMPLDAGASKVVQLGKEAMTRVTEMMKRLRTPSNLKETTYFGDVKMWEVGDVCDENPPQSPFL